MPPRPSLLQPLLNELAKLARLPDCDIDYSKHVVRRGSHPARLLHDDELALRVERDGEQACAERLFEERGVEERGRARVGEEGEGEVAEGRVVD